MTKDTYFEMCEMMGFDPIEEDIPVEFEDLPLEVQEAYQVYDILTDNWEGMSGSYLGKHFAGIQDIMSMLGIEDPSTTIKLIMLIDQARREFLQTKKAKNPPPKP